MEDFYDFMVETSRLYFHSVFTLGTFPEPVHFWIVDHGTTAASGCRARDGSMTARSDAYFYCGSDRAVYLGQDELWHYYHDIGDAAAIMAFAHEWGHHLQEVAGVYDHELTQAETINAENQADCVAGAFGGWAIDTQIWEPQDSPNTASLVEEIASSENNPNREHGTLQQREDSMIRGLDGGLFACNAFNADKPLIVQA